MGRDRSGRFWVERTVEQRATQQLGFANSGLMHRIWMDVAWKPRRVRFAGQTVLLEAGQALVSVAEYARESGCTRKTIARMLGQIEAAGWIRMDAGPAGTVVTCLVRPSGDAQEGGVSHLDTSPLEAQETGGGESLGRRGVSHHDSGGCVKMTHGGESFGHTTVNTPTGPTPAGQTPAGPESCSCSVVVADLGARAIDDSGGQGAAAVGHVPETCQQAAKECATAALHPVLAGLAGMVGISPGEVQELLLRGYEEPRVGGRMLQLEAKLRTGWRPAKGAVAWLRSRVKGGHPPDLHHKAIKRLLGLQKPSSGDWLGATARGAPKAFSGPVGAVVGGVVAGA